MEEPPDSGSNPTSESVADFGGLGHPDRFIQVGRARLYPMKLAASSAPGPFGVAFVDHGRIARAHKIKALDLEDGIHRRNSVDPQAGSGVDGYVSRNHVIFENNRVLAVKKDSIRAIERVVSENRDSRTISTCDINRLEKVRMGGLLVTPLHEYWRTVGLDGRMECAKLAVMQ